MSIAATARLGAFVSDSRDKMFSAEVLEKAACCMLDGVGLAILARDEPNVLIINKVVSSQQSVELYASMWSNGQRASVSDAVMANAFAVHAQFHDDTDYSSWAHPGSLIVPVAVSLGEYLDASISEVLGAIVVGYSTIEWLGGRDEVARALIDRGLRTSPVLGAIGASASASFLLGASKHQAANAAAIAASVTGGILEPLFCGSDEWRVQNANAARQGLFAAQLAKYGLQAAEGALDGPKGLLRSLAGLSEKPRSWEEQPDERAILTTVAKPWATLGDNMSAVIAAKLIFDQSVEMRKIKDVNVKIWDKFAAYPGTSFYGPFDRISQAVASMPFNVATMLLCGELEYDKATKHRDDPNILDLVRRIHIVPDTQGSPYDATVTVNFDDGTSCSRDATEADDRQLRHDRATAMRLIESRLMSGGYQSGVGLRLAEYVFSGDAPIRKAVGLLQERP